MTASQAFSRICLFVLITLLLCSSSTQADDRNIRRTDSSAGRVALVIRNNSYDSAALKNPVNDAEDMAAALSDIGFEVIKKIDADKREMISAINQFGQKLRNAEVGLFYFSGHGVQVNGVNYLIPVKTWVETESDVEFEAVATSRILGKMEDAESSLNIVILDACRDNPFARSFRSTLSDKI